MEQTAAVEPKKYYVLHRAGGTAVGPLSKAEVCDRITAGTFQGEELVWASGTREPRSELHSHSDFLPTFEVLEFTRRQSERAAGDRRKANSRWILGFLVGAVTLGSVVLGRPTSDEDELFRFLCLWLVLPLGAGLFARTFADDPEDRGAFFGGGSIVGIIAAVILLLAISNLPAPVSPQNPTASDQNRRPPGSSVNPSTLPETGYVPSADRWHAGGTLHRARVREWKNATAANKLATCADWISAWKRAGLTRKATYSSDALKSDANGLRICLDQALEPIGDNEEVNAYASLSAYLLEILKKE